MIIDVHNHVIPERVIELLRTEPRYGVNLDGYTWTGGNIFNFEVVPGFRSVEGKLAEMAARGIDKAVVSAAPKPLYYYEADIELASAICRETNLGLAEFSAAAPEQLKWMAHLPVQDPTVAVAVLEEALAAGCVGIELGTSVGMGGPRLDEPQFAALWAAIDAARIPVLMHAAYEPADREYATDIVWGLLYEATVASSRLITSGLFDRYSNLTVIVALGGGYFPYQHGRLRHNTSWHPALKGAPADPWSYVGRLKFDTHTHDARALRYLIDVAGAENVFVGSDCSFNTATPDPVAELRDATKDDAASFELISDRNARLLFGF
ncbi:MAG: amidohydrolase family protein [Actinomycetes bacterium]